ncbi:histidine kinase dimerization/phosphoacceptor domain-containing protein [Nonomuraea harbinensis]|uniref:Histidine kinase dimerization/phosphoacceptor domain-containing protein n=1 Tax=Nonomuraea harbinensis TaxID=1286938 RepID=A0ABW1BLL8_9ACTN|nr:histidine kinase dimerization/phosphoacceptor domain-containing protein [Nonomuraea harbinensis]
MSRSLHDGLGRTLVAMARTIDLARGGPADCPHATDTLLRDLRRGMDDATDHVRVLLYGLPTGGSGPRQSGNQPLPSYQ